MPGRARAGPGGYGAGGCSPSSARGEERGIRRGIGRALLVQLARRCVTEDLARLEWSVLDWNEPALRFYRALGAQPLDEWTVHRVTGTALATLAADAARGAS